MNNSLYFLIVCTLFVSSCKKDWLEIKSDKAIVVPSTINDFQGLLDNTNIFNRTHPTLGEIGADDYYVLYDNYKSLASIIQKNAHIWADDVYAGTALNDWNEPYKRIYYSNVALEGIESIPPNLSNQSGWNNVKGSALFNRSFEFYILAQLFAKPYETSTANSDLGIVLKLKSDVKEKSVRSTVQETYDQIINDLLVAKDLLPITPKFKTRPSKPAVFALLARTFLTIGDVEKALVYSDSCIKMYPDTLMNFNYISGLTGTGFAIPQFNSEVIYHSRMPLDVIITSQSIRIVDSNLYKSYNTNDLRRSGFFLTSGGQLRFKGSYEKSTTLFSGLALDEIYLIRAECFARKGDVTKSIQDLNSLMIKRWKNTAWSPFTASDANDALRKILAERRKELLYRGIRWTDLRRLNKEPLLSTTITRNLNGQVYTLPPNSIKYVWPIPDNEVLINGLIQNPRQ